MKRILLIGRGPLPGPDTVRMGFSELRTAAFAQAIASAGTDLRTALLVREPTPKPGISPTSWSSTTPIQEESPGWIDRLRALAKGADGIVSAGPYNPGRAAIAIAHDTPVWVDVPGDPMSELGALARVASTGLNPSTVAAAVAACTAVLNRADAISVISGAQRHAALGQLGLMGRTLTEPTTPPVHIVPITSNFGFDEPTPPARTGRRTTIALSGAFNPWFDDERVCAALDEAFRRRPDIAVVVTGGGIAGFYEEGFRRFQQWARQHPTRVTIHEWLPHADVEAVLRTADIGLSMDRPGPEPELGSRTRLLLFASVGLIPASTVVCELTREWRAAGALVGLDADPVVAGAQLASIDTADATPVQKARALMSPSIENPALAEWCADPRRVAPGVTAEGVLTAELESLKEEITAIRSSPTWTTLNALHSLGLRRLWSRHE